MPVTPIPTQGERQITIPVDENGNAVGVIFDAVNSVYRLAVDAIFGGALVIGSVELEDGGAGTTRQSVKLDAVATGAQGSAQVAGKDSSGDHQSILVKSTREVVVAGGPGATITSNADVVVGIGATVALGAVPANSRRVTVQVTDGDSTTRIRIRESAGTAGAGKLLDLLGSTTYGGADGSVAALEAENAVGPASAVAMVYERD